MSKIIYKIENEILYITIKGILNESYIKFHADRTDKPILYDYVSNSTLKFPFKETNLNSIKHNVNKWSQDFTKNNKYKYAVLFKMNKETNSFEEKTDWDERKIKAYKMLYDFIRRDAYLILNLNPDDVYIIDFLKNKRNLLEDVNSNMHDAKLGAYSEEVKKFLNDKQKFKIGEFDF